LIIRKSPDELDKMRMAGRIVAGTIGRVLEAVAPGRTTLDLDRAGRAVHRPAGRDPFLQGISRSFLAALPCNDLRLVNDEIVHGIPSSARRLQEGDRALARFRRDLAGVPFGFRRDGFVGGIAPSAEAERLVKTTEAALDAAIAVSPRWKALRHRQRDRNGRSTGGHGDRAGVRRPWDRPGHA
jgi:Methionine aminopeptidase